MYVVVGWHRKEYDSHFYSTPSSSAGKFDLLVIYYVGSAHQAQVIKLSGNSAVQVGKCDL